MFLPFQTDPVTAAIVPGGFDILFRLGLDIVCVLILVRGIYYRVYGHSELMLTLISFNLVIFLITWLLNSVEITMGAAFGLFAVFSMLRFRTEGLAVGDMTYLFLAIALGLLMAVNNGGMVELAIISVTLLAGTALLESRWFTRRERSQPILYDNLALLASGNQDAIMADVRTRTGLGIHRIEVREIDLLKDVVRLQAYYYEERR